MKIIYVTNYTYSTRQATSTSVDSGFKSLQEVIDTFGKDNCNHSYKRMVIHGSEEDRTVFSDFKFHIDDKGTMS